ncbi:MAG TPA: peptidoglycan DD-metalloendopeptidase family protein [Negativicutes bacterium]|nr:peptidoglycan DD-metalloendopeptidase family protein [Negativicutes bacterium]
MKKALVKNKRNYATFMFIPESQSDVRSFRMPVWFPRFVTISIILLVIASAACFSILSSLRLQYDMSRREIRELTAINSSQKVEIQKLQKNSEEIQKQLEENSKTLEDVKKAVGLPSAGNEGASGSKPASSVENSSTTGLKEKAPAQDMSAEIAGISASFVSLSDSIAAQKKAINASMAPIQKQLAYLMAKPSIVPVTASITAGFGYRKNPFTSRGSEFHSGMDFAASYGQNVAATGDGIVIFAGWNSGYGKMVIISHGYGLSTIYGHNSKLLVKQGDKVKKGQTISKVGNTGRSTGTHLHYEVRLNGKSVNPSKYF